MNGSGSNCSMWNTPWPCHVFVSTIIAPIMAATPVVYDTAWADYTTGQWALAIQGFEAYMETFPRSELTDNAQFYIGQTYFADGRFEDAVVALLGLPERVVFGTRST